MAAATALAAFAAGCSTGSPAPKARAPAAVLRFGSVIGLKDEKLDYYKKLHAAAWPGVLGMLRECNVRNYSIYLHRMDDGKLYLFSYFEYVGDDLEGDMAKLSADETIKKWWKETDPCQFLVENRKEGERWASMEEVFHCD
jgi:L-rhamnose mutarotase